MLESAWSNYMQLWSTISSHVELLLQFIAAAGQTHSGRVKMGGANAAAGSLILRVFFTAIASICVDKVCHWFLRAYVHPCPAGQFGLLPFPAYRKLRFSMHCCLILFNAVCGILLYLLARPWTRSKAFCTFCFLCFSTSRLLFPVEFPPPIFSDLGSSCLAFESFWLTDLLTDSLSLSLFLSAGEVGTHYSACISSRDGAHPTNGGAGSTGHAQLSRSALPQKSWKRPVSDKEHTVH